MAKKKAEEQQKKLPLASPPDLTEADLAGAYQSDQLPLEHETASVKTVKASWYKQLLEEEALDAEHGMLAGKPLAVLNVHGRSCPQASHVHLLWKRNEGILRLSLLFLDMQDDPRYKEAQKQSLKRLQALSDLLALCLSPTASYDTKRNDRKQLRMDTYQLSLSLDIYKVLEQMQKTRASYYNDVALWQWMQRSSPPEQNGKSVLQQAEAVALAQEVMKELTELGVQVFHPDLIDRRRLSRYTYDVNQPNAIYRSEVEAHLVQDSTRPPAPSGVDATVFLYWEWKRRDNSFELYIVEEGVDDEEGASSSRLVSSATMLRLGRTHGYALRLAITEPALESARQRAESMARSYATAWSLFQDASAEENTEPPQLILPAPTTLWEQILEQKHLFEKYQQRWKESLQTVADLEQLFIA